MQKLHARPPAQQLLKNTNVQTRAYYLRHLERSRIGRLLWLALRHRHFSQLSLLLSSRAAAATAQSPGSSCVFVSHIYRSLDSPVRASSVAPERRPFPPREQCSGTWKNKERRRWLQSWPHRRPGGSSTRTRTARDLGRSASSVSTQRLSLTSMEKARASAFISIVS